jgi:cation:H+ antiporter
LETLLIILLFLLGLALIVKGGDLFVDAASWIAEVSGIPKFLIGATIVSLATTLPELLVSIFAALEGNVDIAAGNAIGSVTANIGLIMGISVVCLPSVIKRAQFAPKAVMMLVSAVLLLIFAQSRQIGIVPSIIMLCVFAVFVAENIMSAKKDNTGDPVIELSPERPTKKIIITNILKFLFGAAGIVVGAQLLVDNGEKLASLMGVPDGIIAVTFIAIGTSLPELVTTVTAIAKKQASLSIGNIIGANIIDLTLIMPLCSVISGKALPVSAQTAGPDLIICCAVALIAIVPTLISKKFRRWQGIAMLMTYAGYIAYLCVNIPAAV